MDLVCHLFLSFDWRLHGNHQGSGCGLTHSHGGSQNLTLIAANQRRDYAVSGWGFKGRGWRQRGCGLIGEWRDLEGRYEESRSAMRSTVSSSYFLCLGGERKQNALNYQLPTTT